MSLRTIASAVDAIAARSPSRIALTSPFQSVRLTYAELSEKTNALASFISTYGFEPNDFLISDLPNTYENLVLQLACNRIGVGYGTTKNLETMAKTFPKVKGVVTVSETGFLAQVGLPLPYLSGEFLQDLLQDGLKDFQNEDLDEGDLDTAHGFYNTNKPYTNQQALDHGVAAAKELNLTEEDTVCVSITLCHPFGIGSAVCSALTTGAAIALPAVGGIQGCGVPSERAEATLDVLQSEGCTVLFADTHTLKALPDASPGSLKLRDGAVKISSGATFLNESREYGGISLRAVGSDA